MDRARQATDKKLEQMERRIKREYKQAQKELTEKWNKYMQSASERVAKLQKQYDVEKRLGLDTTDTAKALQDAKKSATLFNSKYKAMINDTTSRIANANQLAVKYVNNQCAEIYMINYDSSKPYADKYGVQFVHADEQVIKNLFNQKHINVNKDRKWNSKKLNSAVLQGILQGESMQKIAKRILPICEQNKVSAIRNARTTVTQAENLGRLDGYKELENEGLMLTKMWLATMDSRTRESHLAISGEERPLNEEFSNGLMYPADPNGDASEVYNCRCTMTTDIKGKDGVLFDEKQLQEAEQEAEPTTKKTRSKTAGKITIDALLNTTDPIFKEFYRKLSGQAYGYRKVAYKEIKQRATAISEQEIINAIAGGDMTSGSCASLGLAYIGQKKFNLDLLDYRSGSSRKFFSGAYNLYDLSKTKGIKAVRQLHKTEVENAFAMLQTCEMGKEYYLCVGRHASVVKKTKDGFQYLELQHPTRSGWTDFSADARDTLRYRFGCRDFTNASTDFMINIDDSDFSDEFKSLLGFINTDASRQKKSRSGTIK